MHGIATGRFLGGVDEEMMDRFHILFRPGGRGRFLDIESDHGTWIAVHAEGDEDDQGRFSIVGGGFWDVETQWAEEFDVIYAAPLPASPSRHRWAVDCFEDHRL